MNKIFDNKAFIAFLTAGDPCLDKTLEYMQTMVKAGVSLIEVGIPFSDPIAEGKTIEKADYRALKALTTTDKIFDMLKEFRKINQDFPLVFMTYVNPVFTYGYERFFKKCQEVNVSGIIIPDVPYEEKQEVKEVASKYNCKVISLIAPTSSDRIKMIASDAEGFIYLVSSLGVTGVRSKITTDIDLLALEIKKYTNIPIAVGFGVKTPEQAKKMVHNADGVIVGSAIVDIIAEYKDNASDKIFEYCSSMVQAVKSK